MEKNPTEPVNPYPSPEVEEGDAPPPLLEPREELDFGELVQSLVEGDTRQLRQCFFSLKTSLKKMSRKTSFAVSNAFDQLQGSTDGEEDRDSRVDSVRWCLEHLRRHHLRELGRTGLDIAMFHDRLDQTELGLEALTFVIELNALCGESLKMSRKLIQFMESARNRTAYVEAIQNSHNQALLAQDGFLVASANLLKRISFSNPIDETELSERLRVLKGLFEIALSDTQERFRWRLDAIQEQYTIITSWASILELIESDRPDLMKADTLLQELLDSYRCTSNAGKKANFRLLKNLQNSLTKKRRKPAARRSGLGHEYQRDLTRLMLRIIVVFLERDSVDPLKRFLDHYEYFNALRLQPHLWSEFSAPQSIVRSLNAARQILEEELGDADKIIKYAYEKAKYKGHFLSRAAEVYHASDEFGAYDKGQEREDGLERSMRLWHAYCDNPETLDKKSMGFIIPRFADTCHRSGRTDEAIEIYKWSERTDVQLGPRTQWEVYVGLSNCELTSARDAKRQRDLIAADDAFKRAEEWLVRAFRIWDPDLDPRDDSGKKHSDENISIHGGLARLYLEWGRYENVEYHSGIVIGAQWPPHLEETNEHYRRDNKYYLAAACNYQGRCSESIEILEELCTDEEDPRRRLKYLIATRAAYLKSRRLERLSELNEQILDAARESGLEGFDRLTEDQVEALIDADRMPEYIKRCKIRINLGESAAVIQELLALISASRTYNFGRKPDVFLVTLMALAFRREGDFTEAMRLLEGALGTDSGPKNQGYTYFEIGRTNWLSGHLREAAEAFETSYSIGGRIEALSQAASAYAKLGDYETAFRLLDDVERSGRDDRPEITQTIRARALRDRARQPDRNPGQCAVDVSEACRLLGENLSLSDRSPDRVSIELLDRMLDESDASGPAMMVFLEFIRDGRPELKAMIVDQLESADHYFDELTEAILSIPARELRRELQNAVCDYVMGLWVDTYLSSSRTEAETAIGTMIGNLRENWAASPILYRLWAKLLGSNKGKLQRRLFARILEDFSRHLVEIGSPEGRENACISLNRMLGTRMFGYSPRAFAGRDPGEPLVEVVWRKVQDLRSIPSPLANIIDDEIQEQVGEEVFVEPFQTRLAFDHLFKRLIVILGDPGLFATELMDEIRFVVKPAEPRDPDRVQLVLRIEMNRELSETDRIQFFDKLKVFGNLADWGEVTKDLLPTPIMLQELATPPAVQLVLTLWTSAIGPATAWNWRPFYDYVLTDTWDGMKDSSYYEKATAKLNEISLDSSDDLTRYALTHLDSLFERCHRAMVSTIGVARAHAFLNLLDPVAGQDPKMFENAMDSLLEICDRLIVEPMKDLRSRQRRDSLQITEWLEGWIARYRNMFPDVTFEIESQLNPAGGDEIWAFPRELEMVLLDIVHNGVKAIRCLHSDQELPRQIQLVLLPEAELDDREGIGLIVRNTGSIRPEDSHKIRGQGLGFGSCRRIIVENHRGAIRHGALDGQPPFTYEWFIVLPRQD